MNWYYFAKVNKGEALHSLRSHLFYANQGEIKTQQDDQLLNQVGCLNLVTNAMYSLEYSLY